MTVREAMQLAAHHHQAGRLHEAEGIYRQVLSDLPDNPHALHYLGLVMQQTGNSPEAARLMRRSIEIDPAQPHFYTNLAGVMRSMGDLAAMEQCARKAIELSPQSADAHCDLGYALMAQEKFESAIEALRQADQLEPNRSDVQSHLGNCYKLLGKIDDSIEPFERAAALEPGESGHLANLASARLAQNRVNEAVDLYRRAVERAPQIAAWHFNLGLALLVSGELPDGLAEYEWRLRTPDFVQRFRTYTQPVWDGGDLSGKTILLHPEQGFGDAIQFVRYVPMVAARGARVVLEAAPQLFELFKSVRGVDQLIQIGDAFPPVDLRCSLLSLSPDPQRKEEWRTSLAGDGLRVGLAWAGSPTNLNDRNRSFTLATLARLADVPGVRFFSLQTGPAGAQAAEPPAGMNLTDLSEGLRDFADTAAVVNSLDLVITADTALAHLAGALGRPVWNLLPFAPDWRWMLEREDTPWYPSMRLLRQRTRGDWAEVIDRVADRLGRMARGEPS
jgi:tetratricopeptide (TPR) repeat protein